jgi:hypothetical protein
MNFEMKRMVYGKSYQRARKERMEFAGNRCEICGHDGSEYPLQCHHRGGEAYEKDARDEMTMHDCVILCTQNSAEVGDGFRCHDLITNRDRKVRNKSNESYDHYGQTKTLPKRKKRNVVKAELDWNICTGNAQQYTRGSTPPNEKKRSRS